MKSPKAIKAEILRLTREYSREVQETSAQHMIKKGRHGEGEVIPYADAYSQRKK